MVLTETFVEILISNIDTKSDADMMDIHIGMKFIFVAFIDV